MWSCCFKGLVFTKKSRGFSVKILFFSSSSFRPEGRRRHAAPPPACCLLCTCADKNPESRPHLALAHSLFLTLSLLCSRRPSTTQNLTLTARPPLCPSNRRLTEESPTLRSCPTTPPRRPLHVGASRSSREALEARNATGVLNATARCRARFRPHRSSIDA